jgi:hypothetical protein
MRNQKTPLRFKINVYTRRSTPSVGGCAAQQRKRRRMLRRTATASAANGFSRNLRLSDYVMWSTAKKSCERQHHDGAANVRTREGIVMEMPTKQAPIASSEIVKLIRKLRWVGLEEKAERLEKELEEHAVTDTVVSVQSETD